MKYEDKLEKLIKGHRVLMEMQDGKIKSIKLPPHVKKEKLEAAFEELKNDYVIIFKKKEPGHK